MKFLRLKLDFCHRGLFIFLLLTSFTWISNVLAQGDDDLLNETNDFVGSEIDIEISPRQIYIRDGDRLNATCQTSDLSRYTTEWYRVLSNGQEIEITTGPNLLIPVVSQAQLQYSQIYCRARDRYTDQIVGEPELLDLFWESSSNYGNLVSEARITRHEFKVSIRHPIDSPRTNEPYEMVCYLTPMPSSPINFTWFYRGRVISTTPIYTIPRFSSAATGNYTCSVSFEEAGQPISLNSIISLDVRRSLEREISLARGEGADFMVFQGDSKELHCEGSENDRSGWYFNEVPIEEHDSVNRSGNVEVNEHLKVSILALHRISLNNEGVYSCVVKGEKFLVRLRVERSVLELSVNPPSTDAREGEDVELHCVVSGASDPSVVQDIIWFFSPRGSFAPPIPLPLPGSPGAMFIRKDRGFTSFISSRSARIQMDGIYYCRLRSSPGLEAKGDVKIMVPVELQIIPGSQRVRVGVPFEFTCISTDPSVVPKFRTIPAIQSVRVIRQGPGREVLRFMEGIDPRGNGTIVECYAPGSEPKRAYVLLDDVCQIGFRRCNNGQCMHPAKFCDGSMDCLDRSDESPERCRICDPIAMKCQVHNGVSPSKDEYMIHWECDGENDCGNSYDESRCPVQNLETCHRGEHYDCQTGGSQIPRAFICDNDPDCNNNSDEQGCMAPIIVSSGTPIMQYRPGSTITLTCRARGHPQPRVIWRFNWGCLPEELRIPNSRFEVRSSVEACSTRTPTVISTLTIRNFRNGDDGIYNCEALAGAHRALSDDMVVRIEP